MKDLLKKLWILGAIALLPLGFSSCSDDNDDDETTLEKDTYGPIISAYVDNTVVPTYKALAEAALEMRTANENLKSNKTDASMQAAADAWMKARIEWELSEAFLFGPVSEDGMDIDAHIDSWPLDLNQINAQLKEIEKNPSAFTGKEAWQESGDVIGFHVTEYLLYRDGKVRKATELTEAELHYLTAATDAMIWDCILAYVAWVGEDNISATMKTVFNENSDIPARLKSVPSYNNFGNGMKTATGSNYNGNWNSPFDEISEGATEIADEVGTTKIESPYIGKNVLEVESWYSWHSLDDYTNNIYSIRNAFYGKKGATSAQTNSLSAFLKEVDPDLNDRIVAKIQDCIDKIQNMGKGGLSFYEVVRDQVNKTEVEAAVEACSELADLFEIVTNKNYVK